MGPVCSMVVVFPLNIAYLRNFNPLGRDSPCQVKENIHR
ncbi:hypothetical protein thalar_02514 [Litoreibacter arenae DSM 19593]|uniref:Uncharacterized protein n=1 Tax=Litoreibacter arenae DSM 19593 TaxID=1123360 RepID=S9RJJ3_9RHOB|nr:hypothetical protein thalar_02514 [Litoreibacter arenae DSM 19593]